MAATQAQRAALYTTLVDTLGDEAAETLMSELPLGGWDQVVTKSALSEGLAAISAELAHNRAELTALRAEMHEGFARADKERAEGFVQAAKERAEGFAQAAKERAEGFARADKERAEGFARADKERAEGFARADKGRAELMRSQARHMYVVVSAICAATVSIWVALFVVAIGS